MIQFTRKTDSAPAGAPRVTLTLDQRRRSRLVVVLDDGREAGIRLPRGTTLRDGDCLASEDGQSVLVRAAPECLSRVECGDALALARACYHLGNRHVALQIEPGRLSYLHDHVLDDLVLGLGLPVRVDDGPFEPEPGAYGGQGHGHDH
ncbi:urease accessory protein UreE [uncultured Thiodictyon sp.]|uniref:urease accessory protein UreE n=1 Tax=uncultured Thiodictyon sp. TaxID=1846217 RepID=UPI0025F68D1F|nr:urease accessory protein UreE [uncultured Thiodictyon sp.]